MGAGKLVIPARMMAIMRESVIACLRLIQKDSTYGNVFNQTVGSYSDIIKYLVSGLSYAAFTATDDTVTSK
jgi:hypothetical protein